MPVTDEQEATLHAQLAGKPDEHLRLLAALDPVAGRTGYTALVAAAFSLAAVQRFPEDTARTEAIEYVDDVRSRVESAAQMDPRVAERLILGVLTGEEIDDIDARTSFEAQLLLLAALIADKQLDAEGLDRFMARARKLADRWLA